MQSLVEWGVANAATAAVLAVCMAVITRIWRNPHLAHLLWLIVLLRLAAPPIVRLPLPTLEWRAARNTPAAAVTSVDAPEVLIAESSTPRGAEVDEVSVPLAAPARTTGPIKQIAPIAERPVSEAPTSPTATSIPVWDLLAGVWISGSVLYATLTIVRVRRFGREIRRSASIAPTWLESDIHELSQTIALPRTPRVRVVDWTLPPMIWSGVRPTLLVPHALVESIDPAQRRLLLLHELLHVRRRDPFIRWFAVAMLAAYWWNPFGWWAVRKLQDAQEECCDAAVLTFDPQHTETYGEALLVVSEFVSCGSLPAPAVSVGVERKHHLKRRMTMILGGTQWRRLTKTQVVVLLICGAAIAAFSCKSGAGQVEPPTQTGASTSPDGAATLQPEHVGLSQVGSGSAASHSAPAAVNSKPMSADGLTRWIEQAVAKELEFYVSPGARPGGPVLLAGMAAPSRGDDAARRVLKRRHNAALCSLQLCGYQYETGTTNMSTLLAAGRTLLDAKLALAQTSRERARTLNEYLKFTQDCWRNAKSRLAVGGTNPVFVSEESQAREATLEAGLRMAQLPGEGDKATTVPAAISQPPNSSMTPSTAVAQQSEAAIYGWKLLTINPDDDEQHKQLKRKYNVALSVLEVYQLRQEIAGTLPPVANLLPVAKQVRDAELALCEKQSDRLQALERYLAFTKVVEQFVEQTLSVLSNTGKNDLEVSESRDARLSAEIELQALRNAIETITKTEESRVLPRPATEPQPLKTDPTVTAQPGRHGADTQLPVWLTAKPRKPASQDTDVRRLLKDRYNAALKTLQLAEYNGTLVDPLPVSTANVGVAARTLLDADLALAAPQETLSVYQRYLELTRYLDRRAAGLLKLNLISPSDFEAVHQRLLDAEIKLMQAKGTSQPAPSLTAQRIDPSVRSWEIRVRIAEAEVAATRAVVQQGAAELKRALANLKWRETQFGRVQTLRKQNSVSQDQVDEAVHLRDDATASVEAARASIAAAEAQGAIKIAQLEQVQLELKLAKEGVK